MRKKNLSVEEILEKKIKMSKKNIQKAKKVSSKNQNVEEIQKKI